MIWKILSLLLLISLSACQSELPPSDDPEEFDLPDEQADSVRIVATKGNKTDYILIARHVDKYYDKKYITAQDVTVETFNPDGSIRSVLTCDHAEMDEIKNLLIANGNVVITSDNGVLRTPDLFWNRNNDEIRALNGVELERDENTLWGEAMRTDIELNQIEIVKVSALGKIDEEDFDW
ncbi:MAG: LPS export ABC transporter periplasmic protein LptC [Candidatus Cloacimonetes bacterium]|nr:LPS export ABC transporter periplasmic protein LptC [Candidatus Cloacimonadota bacterium]